MAKGAVNKFKKAVQREMNSEVVDVSDMVELPLQEKEHEPVAYEIITEKESENIESQSNPSKIENIVPKTEEIIPDDINPTEVINNEEFAAIKHLFQEKRKPDYKNKTYYMQVDIIEIIKKISDEKNLSESSIVTTLLKSALGIK